MSEISYRNIKMIYLSVSIFFFLSGFLLFWPVFEYSYNIFDDFELLISNSHINQGFTVEGIKWAFSINDKIATYLPVTWMSHMLDFTLFKESYGFHHGVNVILHILNSLLISRFLCILLGRGGIALLIGFIFLIHPIHVEPVVWIMGRKDLLATFFGVLCLTTYSFYKRNKNSNHSRFALLFFILSMASKSSFLALPFILVTIDIYMDSSDIKLKTWRFYLNSLVSKYLFLAVSFTFGLIGVLNARSLQIAQTHLFSLPTRMSNVVVNLFSYLSDIIFPQHLCIYYPIYDYSHFEYGMSFVVLIFLAGIAMAKFKNSPVLLLAFLIFIFSLLPFLGLFQLSIQSRANRYAYFAMVSPYLALYGLSEAYIRKGKLLLTGLLLLYLPFLVLKSRFQIDLWQNDEKLWQYCIDVTSKNPKALASLCQFHYFNESVKPEESQKTLVLLYDIKDQISNPNTLNNMGTTFEKLHQKGKARECYLKALNYDPNLTQAHYNLAFIYFDEQNFERAISHLDKCLKIEPENLEFKNAREWMTRSIPS